MSKITAYGLFISFIVTGLFIGIKTQTGLDVSSEGLVSQVINAISETIPAELQGSTFSFWKFLIPFIGITSIIADIVLLLAYGKLGIIIGILGFGGGLLLTFYTIPAFIFLLVGGVLAHSVDSYSET